MKKVIALFALLCVLLALCCPCALATDGAALECTGTKSAAGDTVTVSLSIKDNPGISSLKVKIEYDSKKLRLSGVEGTNTWKDFMMTTSKNLTDYPFNILWVNDSNTTADGILAQLQFTVVTGTEPGSTDISISCMQCFDQTENKVTAASCKGTVQILDITQVVQTRYTAETRKLCLENVPAFIDVYAVVYRDGCLAWLGICKAQDGKVIINLPQYKGDALEIKVFYLDGTTPAGSVSRFDY